MARSAPAVAPSTMKNVRGLSTAQAAISRCFGPGRNSKAARAGRVSSIRFRARLDQPSIAATGWSAPKFIAAAAGPTSGMCFRMVRRQRVYATASMGWLCVLRQRHRHLLYCNAKFLLSQSSWLRLILRHFFSNHCLAVSWTAHNRCYRVGMGRVWHGRKIHELKPLIYPLKIK